MRSMEAIRRKLRGVTAVLEDKGITQHEKANAEAVRKRLEQQLREVTPRTGDWTDNAFRVGKWTREIKKAISPAAPKRDWPDQVFRLGKAIRRSYKSWLSQ